MTRMRRIFADPVHLQGPDIEAARNATRVAGPLQRSSCMWLAYALGLLNDYPQGGEWLT
jgi:hypothetical protein